MIELFATASTIEMINQIQSLTMDWVGAMIIYVNDFIKFIMPTMIYVITFKLILFKS